MTESTELIYPYPAKVLRVDMRQMDMTPMLDMLKKKHMMDPAVMEERVPFIWSGEISNNNLDAYFTRMLPSSLANYAVEAAAGVSFQNSHRHNELPMGRSFDGRLTGADNAQVVTADFFTLPGLNLNGVETDDFIDGIRSGIISDLSIGFFGGTHFCDICHMNYLSYDCPHVAGIKYDIQGQVQTLATVGIDGAHLAEVSAVYDGATPDATILKAQRMIDAGELKPEAVRMLEARYRMNFVSKRSFAGIDLQGGKKLELQQLVNQIREVMALKEDDDLVSAVLSTTGERDRLRVETDKVTSELVELRAKVTELTPQAADGVAYRSDLVAEALAEGVRAMGEKFSAATYETVLRNAPLSVVKQMKADWAAVGNSRFTGGRKTVDTSEAPGKDKAKRKPYVPESAYRS